jgi:glycosyltransferase involved in cell wall biosynthesis
MGHAYYLHKIARHPQLKDYIVHIEAAPDALLSDLRRQASLFLFTSWAEGYGLPVAEALQAGIPVIASNANSIPEVAGDLVDYFEPWNSGQLAALVERFETDPAHRADLKARAARFAPTDWNETIDDIISGLPVGPA